MHYRFSRIQRVCRLHGVHLHPPTKLLHFIAAVISTVFDQFHLQSVYFYSASNAETVFLSFVWLHSIPSWIGPSLRRGSYTGSLSTRGSRTGSFSGFFSLQHRGFLPSAAGIVGTGFFTIRGYPAVFLPPTSWISPFRRGYSWYGFQFTIREYSVGSLSAPRDFSLQRREFLPSVASRRGHGFLHYPRVLRGFSPSNAVGFSLPPRV